jgi:hypothetical protein
MKINQYVFTISRPNDRLHKNFNSTWIHGNSESEAKEILARTYREQNGFVLTLKYDLFSIENKKNLEINLALSLNSARL